ncbi:MAG: hypothetical protein J7L34_01890 [Thermotogaceae bacterium]|nr:hypothetical protein [Thermotogaceae bacterium]
MAKALGKGLDIFFPQKYEESLFQKALACDENGEYIEAFHLYMCVAKMMGKLRSKALNNAAVILAEKGFLKRAKELLQTAFSEDPENPDVRENLRLLQEGDDE